jgi:hydrogenase maturation protein HypF
LGVLFAICGEKLFGLTDLPLLAEFTAGELKVLQGMLIRQVNCPLTTSAGRLFDAVAALAGLRQRTNFEGQSAMALEWAVGADASAEAYPFEIRADTEPALVDWKPLIAALLADRQRELPLPALAAKFHRTLAEIIVAMARRVGEPCVILTGGCFQNRVLTELAVAGLRQAGFKPYWHQRVPPNDGGIALGQAVLAGYHLTGA